MTTIDPAHWRKLSPFLDIALDLAGDERVAWLEALRADRPVLAEELQGLLAEHETLNREGFLADSPSRLLRPSLARLVVGRVLAKHGETVESRKAFHLAIEKLSNTVDADHPMLPRANELERE